MSISDVDTVEELLTNLEYLLEQIGDKATCKGYFRMIWWVTHKNGKKAPYTIKGVNHFHDCPYGIRFRKSQ